MNRFLVTGALAGTALAFVVSTARAQYVDVPTFVAGTPTFSSRLQEADIAIVWAESNLTHSGSSNRIVSQLYARNGIALGPPNRIDTSAGARWPLVAAKKNGENDY